jgi:hypothetical protein
VFVCTLQDDIVPNARLHFRHVKHGMAIETETFDDLTVYALIRQKIHAACASRG